jgi:hypothetical protein
MVILAECVRARMEDAAGDTAGPLADRRPEPPQGARQHPHAIGQQRAVSRIVGMVVSMLPDLRKRGKVDRPSVVTPAAGPWGSCELRRHGGGSCSLRG